MTDADRDDLIQQWRYTKGMLDEAKKAELDLRKQIVAGCFTDDQVEGTERIELGKGYELKAVKKMNYRFVGKQDEILAVLNRFPHELSKRLATWKATLSTREFKLLDEPQWRMLKDVVEIKPSGMPGMGKSLMQQQHKEMIAQQKAVYDILTQQGHDDAARMVNGMIKDEIAKLDVLGDEN